MEKNDNEVSWKVLGVAGIIAICLILGVVYIEVIQSGSGSNSVSVERSTDGKVEQHAASSSQHKEPKEDTSESVKEETSDRGSITKEGSSAKENKSVENDKISTERFDLEEVFKESGGIGDPGSTDKKGYWERRSEDSTGNTEPNNKSLAYKLATINSGYVEEATL